MSAGQRVMYRAILISALLCPLSLWAKSLFVFVPTEIKANIIENKISETCKNIQVTVFGRAKDFHKQVVSNPPSTILSLLPVIQYSKGYSPLLQGTRRGSDSEDYVLVSIDQAIGKNDLDKIKIGVLDLLGRRQMNQFVSHLFQEDIKVKRVTKMEDLLPLLSFGSVQGLFISEHIYRKIAPKTELNLVATSLNIRVGIASAAFNSEGDRDEVTNCITKFEDDLNEVLGVESWQRI